MTGIMGGIGIGLLTNAVYDTVKYVGNRLGNSRKIKDRDLIEMVEHRVLSNASDDVKPLLESSVFVGYFCSAQCIDLINAYIEYKIIYNCSNANVKVKQHIKKAGIIRIQDVIEYISNNIYQQYIEHEVLDIPDSAVIKKAVLYVISISEIIATETLNPESTRLLYLINSRLDDFYENIIDLLIKLHTNIEGIQAKQITGRNDEYEKIKDRYCKVLKDKNSDAHIYLLDKFPFERFYVPPILQRISSNQAIINIYDMYGYYGHELIAWKDIFEKENIVYLTGGAGYGKSLFAKKIINNYTELNIFHANEYVVIYGELKNFYPNGSTSALSVIEFLKQSVRNSTLIDVSTEFIEHYLNAGRCIILLDALDEVDKQKRNMLHESVVAYFKNQNPNNKICITSRDRGFIPERNVEVFKIRPLNEEQIEKYVDKIIALDKFEKEEKNAFMTQSRVLVEKGFLNSFLVLSLLINIYKAELELPENKLELYQKCFEYIANKREKDKTQEHFDWRMITPIMKDNTFIELSRMGMPNNTNIDRGEIKDNLLKIYKSKYGSEAEAENAIEEFLKFCSDRTELFVPSLEDKYKFFHRSFFEYFYSLYIFFRCNSVEEILNEFQKFDVDSEVFELTVAMLKQKSETKYQELVDSMLSSAYDEFENGKCEYHMFNILVLSMQVVDDALYKKQFLDIIISQKSIIKGDLDKIHNLRLIPRIFDGDKEAYAKICETYYDECLMIIFNNLDMLFRMTDEYKRDRGEDLFEKMSTGKNWGGMQRLLGYKSHEGDNKFLMTVFTHVKNCKEIILTASDEFIMSLYKRCLRKNYKKRAVATRAYIDRFLAFSPEQQDRIIDLIMLSNTKM